MEGSNNIHLEGEKEKTSPLYLVRDSQVFNALSLPTVLVLIGIVSSVLVAFYGNKDALTVQLQTEITNAKQECRNDLFQLDRRLTDAIIECKTSAAGNREQIIELWRQKKDKEK